MDHRHTKRHSSAGKRDVVPSTIVWLNTAAAPGTAMRPLASALNEGHLTTVKEEDAIDGSFIGGGDEQLLTSNSAMTFALTSKHLLATTDSRSAYHGTRDLSTYQTLCQQKKSSSRVPSPYHAMESVILQNVKPASKSSEIGSEDTGYKSTSTGSFASHEMHVRHRKSNELQVARHKERVDSLQRMPTQNQRPPHDPNTLAALLIEKLEQVRRAQGSVQDNQYRSREDLSEQKEDAQSILDDHISRVFGDSSGELSPREKVSSWVMDAKKYYDVPLEDKRFASQRSDNVIQGFLPIELSDVGHHGRQRRPNASHHRLGLIDEGLGSSINSLTNSATAFGQSSSSLSSAERGWARSAAAGAEEQSRRNVLFPQARNTAATSHELNKFSNWFTLKSNKKSLSTSVVSSAPRETISVVYQIVGETLPYLSKVAGSHLTLKQFKSLVPRKGKYRHFFKRMCDELDVGAVFEEIVDDNETLPFWEGKISARLESITD